MPVPVAGREQVFCPMRQDDGAPGNLGVWTGAGKKSSGAGWHIAALTTQVRAAEEYQAQRLASRPESLQHCAAAACISATIEGTKPIGLSLPWQSWLCR